MAEQFKSVYFTADSFHEAKAAASSLCHLVSQIASGNLDNGFAVIRPPGHHAEPSGKCDQILLIKFVCILDVHLILIRYPL